jgi:hypothetical protein
MAHTAEWVDVLVDNEHAREASRLISDWFVKHLPGRVWSTGDTPMGKIFIDMPTAVVEHLRQKGIPLKTQPRDPKRAPPNG